MEQARTQAGDRTTDEAVTVETLKSDITQLANTVQKLASEQMGAVSEEMQDQATRKINDLEAAIRRNPTQAAAIAAGVGFLLGLVLIR